jgi:hypothetical protein
MFTVWKEGEKRYVLTERRKRSFDRVAIEKTYDVKL